MENIAPYKDNSEWAAFRGHFYVLRQKKGTSKYFKCSINGCLANIVCKVGVVEEKRPHNHEPQEWIPERNQLYQQLKIRSKREHISIREIYDTEALRFPTGALHLPFPESTMRKWRRSVVPPTPLTLEAYGVVLEAQVAPQYLCTVRGHNEGGRGDGGSVAIIFAMQHFTRNLAASDTLLLDGTFKCVPAAPRAAQLLTIHTIVEGRAYHPVVALMENRTTALYVCIMEELKRRAAFGNIVTIISDYEISLLRATSHCFPNAIQKGCFFHFAQAIVRRARQMRTINIYSDSRKRILRLMKCLALLPAENVQQGLEFVQTCAEGMPEFGPLFEYFRQYWMTRIGPGVFSVHGEPNRTNNIAENFHSRLARRFGAIPHPSIWRFTEMLQSTLQSTALDFERAEEGLPIPVSRAAVKMLSDNRRLRVDEGLLKTAVISIGEFLNRAAGIIEFPVLYNEADLPMEAEVEVEVEVPAPPPPPPPPQPLAAAQQHVATCVVCLAEVASVVLVPCGHFCMCIACSEAVLDRCPVCREYIRVSQRVFLPL